MLDSIFTTIMTGGSVTAAAFFAASACSLVLGAFIAFLYSRKNSCSSSFLLTLVLLPAIVQIVIMMVNGNIGAGVAVAGAFSLVRFRSVAGKGQEITAVFLAMAVGLATGMGYLAVAAVFTVVLMGIFSLLHSYLDGHAGEERELRIIVPEDLDYEGVFDDLFAKYTDRRELVEVKTAEMGSVYKLRYTISLNRGSSLKQFMDEIRMRNGNLEVACGRPVSHIESL